MAEPAAANEKADRLIVDRRNVDFLRTTAVELQGRLEGDAFLGGGSFGVRLLGSVEGIDVSLMVLLVMKFHDLL